MLTMPPKMNQRRECKQRKNQILNGLLNNYDKETKTSDNITFDDCIQAPVDFKICGKEIKQEVIEGYNCIDIKKSTLVNDEVAGVQCEKSDETITLNGSRNDGSTTSAKPILDNVPFGKLEANKLYEMSLHEVSGNYEGQIAIAFFNESLQQIDFIQVSNTNKSSKILSFSNQQPKHIRIAYNGAFMATNFKFKLMLKEGTEEKPYEAYGQSPSKDYPSEIERVEGNQTLEHINKNFIKFKKANNVINHDITIINDGNSKIFLNGTNNGIVAMGFDIEEFELDGEYKLSGYTRNDGFVQLYWKDSHGVIKYKEFRGNPTIKFDKGDKLYQIFFWTNTTLTFNNEEFNLQLEPGSTATSYIKHKSEKIQLSNLPPLYSENDKIVYLNKNNPKASGGAGWYFYNKWIKIDFSDYIVFDHSDGWENQTCFTLPNAIYHGIAGYTTKAELYCNRLEVATPAIIAAGAMNKIGLGSNNVIFFSIEGKTSIADYVEYFRDNPTYLIAPLEEPTYTKITDEILIEQLDKLRSLLTYEGKNHFIVTSENGQACNLEVTVYKNSIKIMQKEIDNLKKLVLNNVANS